MKTKTIILSFLVIAFPISSFAEEITITVKGMVCSFCAQGLKKTFGKKENVEGIDVDLDKKIVKVETKEGATLKDDEITSIIHDAGFEVLSIQRGTGA
ncbi:MAG: heavy metal-associated domain-containing protein [Armatimonadota bacterium]